QPEVGGHDLGPNLHCLLHIASLWPVYLALRGCAGRAIEAEAGAVAIRRARIAAAEAEREATPVAADGVQRVTAGEVAAQGRDLTAHLVGVRERLLVGGAAEHARGAGAAVHRPVPDPAGHGAEGSHDQAVGGALGDA